MLHQEQHLWERFQYKMVIVDHLMLDDAGDRAVDLNDPDPLIACRERVKIDVDVVTT